MFQPQQVHHTHCCSEGANVLSHRVSVLCWNVYKKNRDDKRFVEFLQRVDADLLVLQEAEFKDGQPCRVEGYSYDAAANITFGTSNFGVLTASRCHAVETKAYLSENREFFFATHKSLLLSRYALEGGSSLLVANVHAINFRENGAYKKEKERILDFLRSDTGPLIVAGDFNAWNSARGEKLLEIADSLGLKRVPLGSEDGVKSMFGNPLDFVFYRGLKLLEYRVLDDGDISDHRPLFTRFEVL